jgi:hypothetical protein
MDITTKNSLIRRGLDEAKRKKLFKLTQENRKKFSDIIHTVMLETYIEGYRDNHRDSGSKKNTVSDRFWRDMDNRKEVR